MVALDIMQLVLHRDILSLLVYLFVSANRVESLLISRLTRLSMSHPLAPQVFSDVFDIIFSCEVVSTLAKLNRDHG